MYTKVVQPEACKYYMLHSMELQFNCFFLNSPLWYQ